MRSIVSSRLGSATDLAADPRGEMREFGVKKGETASDVGRRLQDEKLVRDRLAFLVPLYEDGHEDDLQAGRVHEIWPVPAVSCKPGGSVPEATAHVYGGVPLSACRVCS